MGLNISELKLESPPPITTLSGSKRFMMFETPIPILLPISFTTYAYFHIRKRIIDFIKKNKVVRAPRDIARNMRHVSDIASELYSELQREPLTSEIMFALNRRRGITLSDAMIDSIVIL